MNDKIEKLLMRRAELLRQVKALKADSSAKHCLVAYAASKDPVSLFLLTSAIKDTCTERVNITAIIRQ